MKVSQPKHQLQDIVNLKKTPYKSLNLNSIKSKKRFIHKNYDKYAGKGKTYFPKQQFG